MALDYGEMIERGPSATVAEMRRKARGWSLTPEPIAFMLRWADELEAAYRRVSELEASLLISRDAVSLCEAAIDEFMKIIDTQKARIAELEAKQ